MSARILDTNGWFEIKGNPLSRVGVFDYLGSNIGGPEPDRVYRVFRPAEELADPDCIDSFHLLPWTDEHAMLGDEDEGLTAPERKGVQGVIGEDVYFDEATGMLRGNIKLFGGRMGRAIAAGKRELSAGYRCTYDWSPGSWNGQPYDCVQRKIRGNHLALVDAGRMGPEVSVLDHKFTITFDEKDITPMADEPEEKAKDEGEAPSLEQLSAKIDQIMEFINTLKPVAADEEPEPAKDEDTTAAADEEPVPAAAMDAAIKSLQKDVAGLRGLTVKTLLGEVAQRDALAGKISQHIGTFDHADKTLAEVAAYGADKLGLKVAKGQEQAALVGYFAARPSPAATGIAMDGALNAAPGAVPQALKDYGVK